MTDNMMSHDNWVHSVTKLHQTPQASPSLLEINQVQKEIGVMTASVCEQNKNKTSQKV